MFRNTWLDDSNNTVLPDPKVVCPTDENIVGIEHHCVKLITSEKTYYVIFFPVWLRNRLLSAGL